MVKQSSGMGIAKVNTDISGVYQHSYTPERKEDRVVASKPRLKLPAEIPLTTEHAVAKSEQALSKLLKHSGANYRLNGAPVNHNNSVLATALADATGNGHHILVDRYFRKVAFDVDGATIPHDQLKAAIANATPGNPLGTEDMCYLTLALAAATGKQLLRRDPALAVRALECLQNMDLAGVIRGDATMPPLPPGLPAAMLWSKVQDVAWRTAYILATSNNGYATLQKVANCNGGGINPQDAAHLKGFLNVAYHMLPQMEPMQQVLQPVFPDFIVDPERLLAHARCPGPGTLVGKALRANYRLLCGTSWNQLKTSHPEMVFALAAVRNGFYDDGPDSDLRKAMRRADELVVWEESAIERYNNPKEDRKIKCINIAAPSFKESPLSALLNAGSVRNLHNHCLGESQAAEVAWTQLRQAHLELIAAKKNSLALAPGEEIENAEDEITLADREVVNADQRESDLAILSDSIVKATVLEVFSDYRGLRGRYQGRPMQPLEEKEAQEALQRYAALPESQQIGITEEALLQRFGLLNATPIVLDAGTLDGWTDEVFRNLYPDAADFNAIPNGAGTEENPATDWGRLIKALDRVRGEVNAPKVQDHLNDGQLTVQGLANFMKAAMAGSNLGSSLSTFAAYNYGLSSRNFLTATMSDLIYPIRQGVVPISVGGQFSATTGSKVYVNLAFAASGLSLEFGTRKNGQVAVGVNLFAGYSMKTRLTVKDNILGITAGGSVGFAASYEEARKQALIVRIGRTGYGTRPPGTAGDTQAKAEFNDVIDAAMLPLTEEQKNNGITSQLHKILISRPDVSVTYQDGSDFREKTIKGATSAGASLIGGLGRGRLGGSVGLTAVHGWQPESMQVCEERQGSTRVRQETAVHAFVVNFSGAANAATVTPYNNNAFHSLGTGSVSAGPSTDFFQRSMIVKRYLTIVDGDVSPTSTMSYTHRTADGFAESVLGQIDRWTETEVENVLLQMPAGKRPAKGGDEYKVIEQEARETVRQFVARAQENAEACKNYTEWLQIKKDKAEEINKHRTCAKLAGLANDHEEVLKEEAIAKRIEQDPDSWAPLLLFTSKTQSSTTTRGIPNIGVIMNSSEGMDVGDRETMT